MVKMQVIKVARPPVAFIKHINRRVGWTKTRTQHNTLGQSVNFSHSERYISEASSIIAATFATGTRSLSLREALVNIGFIEFSTAPTCSGRLF